MSTTAVHTPATDAATVSASTSATASTQAARRRDDYAIQPAVDVIEDAQGLTLFADLPGAPREQLQLRVDQDRLVIEAEMQLDLPAGLAAGHVEVSRQFYRRAFTLSKELDADQISAELNHGVLRVRIPKAAHAQPRKIDVKLS
ncbi:HSP20 family molecular chaperone IbpA [Mitsuaria sp. BK045]|uniref:Hsp20/alpha crystallin family protein n=1 Tax=unclassified Roseateles TaxID=2626991 RepID=UPI001607A0E6|nr:MULTISPECIES: Hsp20/alpha crystallin family protein [unclassified Roseateles]MBB3291543.1 HSP20 family molecular chaperone IbpA [Mitsuaria sp. BK041]MBB3360760.1 HSP20 family molecular chaperone IbpA [Mitsuaria sp. BK045]